MNTNILPIKFDPVEGPKLLVLLGFEVEHNEASWSDVGDAENGPKVVGGPAFDEWHRGELSLIVVDGKIVDVVQYVPDPELRFEPPAFCGPSQFPF